MDKIREIIVVGAGAAGLAAAIAAAEEGCLVTILDHSKKCGGKIPTTGNGKCNLGNEELDESCYHGDRDFIRAVLDSWTTEDTIRFFRRMGVCVKSKQGYLYPQSGQAASVLSALLAEARHQKARIKTNCEIETIRKKKGRWSIETPGWTYEADRVILATGSPASNLPCASDSGYGLAKAAGHHIRQVLPSLVPLCCSGVDTKKWAGVRTDGVIRLLVDGKEADSQTGELQLTDFGVSGIALFQLSAAAVRMLHKKKKVELVLDFLPDFTRQEVEAFIREQKSRYPEKSQKEILMGLLPEKLAMMVPEKGAVSWIKELRLSVKKEKSLEAAQVCSGGVCLSEIHPRTMESRLVSGLYFAGEMMDADGICGGYNLHWAWATGYLAGKAAAGRREEGR